jgi:thioesterase domain-containing protein
MDTVTSRDGTTLAYDRLGDGPPVVLVSGGSTDRSANAGLAAELAGAHSVYNYDRRGRGDSGDTPPYAVDRELEDLRALLDEAGGSAHLYGASSGGALALEAAAAGLPADRLAVYEVPYFVADELLRRWRDYVEQLGAALAQDRRGEAVELFMRVAGAADDIPRARSSPMWPGLEAVAHTLAYDAACLGDGRPPTERLAAVTQPTLVATGGGQELFEQAADAIAASLPHAQRLTLDGQSHLVDPKALAPVLARFLGG